MPVTPVLSIHKVEGILDGGSRPVWSTLASVTNKQTYKRKQRRRERGRKERKKNFFLYFQTGYHYVAQAGLTSQVLGSQELDNHTQMQILHNRVDVRKQNKDRLHLPSPPDPIYLHPVFTVVSMTVLYTKHSLTGAMEENLSGLNFLI